MIDSVCYGNWHLHFNSQLIEILSNVASVVEYRGVQNIGSNRSNINRKKLYVIKGTGRWSIISRFVFSFFNDVWQLVITPRDQVLVYSFDPTVSLRSLNALNKVLRKQIIMFRHGSMEMLQTNPEGKGIFYKFETRLIRQFFLNRDLKISKRIHFFVLGDVIIKNLSIFLTEDKVRHFHSIDHPYDFDKNAVTNRKEEKASLSVGTVGVFNEFKGGAELLQLAKILKEKELSGSIHLSITGKIDFDSTLLQAEGISLPSNHGKTMVSEQELKARVDRLDFVLYFYSSETYRLTASGAIFDAINRRRPIIALRNDYFEYIFAKFGSFGYLVDSVSEMAALLERIVTGIEKQVDYDFEHMQNLLSTQNNTKVFAAQLLSIGFIA